MPEPVLDEEELQAFERGIGEFNRGLFYECHETLEEVWHGVRGPARDFFQGLIQLAVACYHIRNGNLRGGRSQLEKGLARLARYPGTYAGIDLCGLRCEAGGWLRALGPQRE